MDEPLTWPTARAALLTAEKLYLTVKKTLWFVSAPLYGASVQSSTVESRPKGVSKCLMSLKRVSQSVSRCGTGSE